MKFRIALLFAVAASLLFVSLMPATVLADSASTYSLQTSGNNISIYETSSVAVNTVEADLTYTGLDTISSIGVTVGSTFNTCTSQTSTSIVCTALGGNITGTHLVATLSFTVKNSSADAAVTANIADSSMILASSDSSDTLNHTALPSATYHYTAPAPVNSPSSSPKPSPAPSHQAVPATATPAQQAPAPTPTGQTLADTNSKPAPVVPTSKSKPAAKLFANTNWSSIIAIVSLIIVVAALLTAAAHWLANHSVHISVTSKPKNQKRQTKKSKK